MPAATPLATKSFVFEPALKAQELSFLSYNVQGLAAAYTGDNPDEKFPRVGALASRYDVALLQEDFVYHDLIRPQLRNSTVFHQEKSRPGVPVMRAICGHCGSGLTTSVRKQAAETMHARSVPLPSCSGWISKGADCWAYKGFQFIRIQLANGAGLGVYNVHLDSGESQSDHKARQAQLRTLGQHLASQDGALVIAGDFNIHGHSQEDMALLQAMTLRFHLEDARAQGRASQWKHKLDYIFYRDSPEVSVELMAAGEALEFLNRRNSDPLSDHPPIFARFRIRPQTPQSLPQVLDRIALP